MSFGYTFGEDGGCCAYITQCITENCCSRSTETADLKRKKKKKLRISLNSFGSHLMYFKFI